MEYIVNQSIFENPLEAGCSSKICFLLGGAEVMIDSLLTI